MSGDQVEADGEPLRRTGRAARQELDARGLRLAARLRRGDCSRPGSADASISDSAIAAIPCARSTDDQLVGEILPRCDEQRRSEPLDVPCQGRARLIGVEHANRAALRNQAEQRSDRGGTIASDEGDRGLGWRTARIDQRSQPLRNPPHLAPGAPFALKLDDRLRGRPLQGCGAQCLEACDLIWHWAPNQVVCGGMVTICASPHAADLDMNTNVA